METTNVTPEDWEEQLIYYSLGAMEPQDAVVFEAALEQCRARTQLATTYMQVVGLMGAAPSSLEPPAGHKTRLMDRLASTPRMAASSAGMRPAPTDVARAGGPIRSTAQGEPAAATAAQRARPAAWLWGSAAAAGLMLVLVAWLVSTLGTVERQAARLAETENRLTEMQGQINIPPGYRTVALAPTSEYTGVSALVIFNPDSSEVWLVADGLQPLPEDLIYELWIIRPPGQGQSEVGGVFGPTETGTAVHRTAAQGKIADYAGFAVSIERKPGVPVREGPVVVVGRFEEQ